ncbi:MAG: RNase adapter RapZ [Bacteroidales bacterium]
MDTAVVVGLRNLFADCFNEDAISVDLLPLSGSSRKYFRLRGSGNTAIGAFNPDKRENRAFLYLSNHFLEAGLPVPKIYATDEENDIYLQQDLGDETLFSFLNRRQSSQEFPEEVKLFYTRIVEDLPRFQTMGHKGLDYSYCYPRAAFDQQSMLWDLNYFKYYFLKLAGIAFDEQSLEDDFHKFSGLLMQNQSVFFMYRDFQSRNIMILNNNLYYIDYQGGRKGSPAYDVASLLYDAKANLPVEFRQELLDRYIEKASIYYTIDSELFTREFYLYVYIRLMQAMGAYGFRGFYEKKEVFLQSIPYALNNLSWVLQNHPLPDELKTLSSVLTALPQSDSLRKIKPKLQVIVRSFSYKKGIPADTSGHGGGFVFDCRALPNPGRYPEYQDVTGKDQVVIDFLSKEPEVADFLFSIYNIVDQSVKNYLDRKFERLTVNFGCTGGQHRSVYSAERLKEHLTQKFGVDVVIEHRELG